MAIGKLKKTTKILLVITRKIDSGLSSKNAAVRNKKKIILLSSSVFLGISKVRKRVSIGLLQKITTPFKMHMVRCSST